MLKKAQYVFSTLIIAFLLQGSSCKEEPLDNLILPSNIQVTIDSSNIRDGKIGLSATAENVNFFSFIYTVDGEQITEESTDGKSEYQYYTSGTFPIEVRAHATATQYSKIEINVLIRLDSGTLEDGYNTPTSYDGYNLVWADEFNGNTLNSDDWDYNVGRGEWGWGNNELQFYHEGTKNCEVKDGRLVITAKEEPAGDAQYTSARILTKGKREFQFGRIDIRAKLPEGQGLWPALWMLGSNIDVVSWPSCGEIDIMELTGDKPGRVLGTAHWGDKVPSTYMSKSFGIGTNKFSDEYHVFSINWEQNKIQWLVDDKVYHTVTSSNVAGNYPFNQKFFFIFNVAVGGQLPGSPDETTRFPQTMEVDFVRVFQKK